MAGLLVATFSASASADSEQTGTTITSTGLKPGQVKHVWLIILENKSYDATFTGLNQNSYLWKTLPAQGALLTGLLRHRPLQPGQLPLAGVGPGADQDLQSDCDVEDYQLRHERDIVTTRTRVQVASAGRHFGAGVPAVRTLRTEPTAAPTPGRADAVQPVRRGGYAWKGYAQDLDNQPGREDAAWLAGQARRPTTRRPTPRSTPSATDAHPANGITTFTGAQANDQYVAKHFPLAVVPLDDRRRTTPAGRRLRADHPGAAGGPTPTPTTSRTSTTHVRACLAT